MLTDGKYREVFSFPVREYYEKAGFDFSKEDFAIPAREFIDLYNDGVARCSLFSQATEVLDFFRMKNIHQFVLSAMKQDMLEITLKQQQISGYFEKIVGLDDHYAVSKIDRGRQLLKDSGLVKQETIIIGDTLHDFEVANELGVRCILIADGHQSKQRLLSAKTTVLDSIGELLGFGW